MKDKQLEKLAEKVRTLRPGQQVLLQDEQARHAFYRLYRAYKVGGVTSVRMSALANGDGTFTVLAREERG